MRFIRFFVPFLFAVAIIVTIYLHVSNKKDYNAPVIGCDTKCVEISVKDDDSAILKHFTAKDEKDGDLSRKIIVESISPFVDGNLSKVTVAVCDSDKNVEKSECDLKYTDYDGPKFKISKQQVYYTGDSSVNLLDGVTASDAIDGNISSKIIVTESEVDLSTEGVYPVKYKVASSLGVTSEISVNVYVYNTRFPESIALKDYYVYAKKGEKSDPKSFIDSYPKDFLEEDHFSDAVCKFRISDKVNYSKEGVYTITYRLVKVYDDDDKEEETLAESYLTVQVR